MSNPKKYEAINGLKTFACFGVVSHHVWANSGYEVKGPLFTNLIPRFTILVFLFMTISAFGMCCGYYEKVLNKQFDIVDFYAKRYLKILPFFGVLCIIDFIISPSIASLCEVMANMTLCFGLIPNAEISVIGVGWFLGTIFAFYLLFPFYCFLLKDKRRAWIVLGVSYIMNYLCRNYFAADQRSVVYCFVFFVVGGLVFLYKDRFTNNKMLKVTSSVICIITIIVYNFVDKSILISIVVVASTLMVSISLCKKGLLINNFTRFIAGISFEIYLSHMMVYRVIEKAHLLRVFSNDYVNFGVVYIAVLVGTVVFALFGKWLINNMYIYIEKRRNK